MGLHFIEAALAIGAGSAVVVSSSGTASNVLADVEQLRYPLEGRVATLVSVVDGLLMATILGILFLGTELLERWPSLAQYSDHAKILLVLVLGAPVFATFMRRRRRLLTQEEGIQVSATQLPHVHAVLVRHCHNAGIAVPELYISDALDHTTSFFWRHHHCIILSTHDFSEFEDASDDTVDFVLAREVGSIGLGHTSYGNELLTSSVAPIPFLRNPLNHVRTLSRDRYGAVLAPRSLRVLIVAASGDRLRRRTDFETYLAQLDAGSDASSIVAPVWWLFKRRVPLAHRVQELRVAGMLKAVPTGERPFAFERRRMKGGSHGPWHSERSGVEKRGGERRRRTDAAIDHGSRSTDQDPIDLGIHLPAGTDS